ncbi:MAG: cation:proton antiporter, partial [Parvularculaceae bacterium]
MTLALTAIAAFAGLWALSRASVGRRAAEAPAFLIAAGALVALLARAIGTPGMPADWIAGAAEACLGALVFISAAQFRVSRLASRCPAAFRLTLGGAPLFLLACSLGAFVLLPQLSMQSALLLGGALFLNGAAFDRRAVTNTPAPAAVKAAVRTESAAIIALGAPIAILLAGNAVAVAPHEAPLAPLLASSVDVLIGFALGGLAGYIAARYRKSEAPRDDARAAIIAAAVSYLLCALIGAEPVIAAGAAGLVWGEETTSPTASRLRMRRLVEINVAPLAYFAFGCVVAPRIFEADLLTVIFAMAAVTIMRAGPRLAMLQATDLPKESQVFLAWFGGAPGAASALFVLALIDDAMLVDHEAFLTVAALAVTAGVFAARLTSRPLANAFLRQSAIARKRRMYA